MNRWFKVKAEFRGALATFAALAIIVLGIASFGPEFTPLEPLGALRFHIAAATLVFCPMLWFLGANWRALLVLCFVVASVTAGGWVVLQQQKLRLNAGAPAGDHAFRVLSFNVRATSEQGQNIADYVIELKPDLAVIVESQGIERALDRLAKEFPYRVGCNDSARCDVSVMSRTPLIEAKVYSLAPFQGETLVTARTLIDGRSVAIVAVHLSKPYFDGASVAELWQITNVLRGIKGSVLVAGDFNTTTWAAEIVRFLHENGLVPAPQLPATWPVRLGALGLPIDNRVTRGGLLIEDIYATEENFGSTHRGLVARIAILDTW
jgi:endonuclease/exonuclease/phosphatase (EEP) superfamily protein YafD